MNKALNHPVSRRHLLTGLGSAGLLAALPAEAGFMDLLQNESGKELLGSALSLGKSYFAKEEQEIEIGTTYYDKLVAKSGGAYPDRNAQEALNRFSQPLIATSQRKKLPWEIKLIKSDQVNAWALPGGKLAINSRLLNYVDDPAELSAVIAHEVGHSELGHGVDQMRTKTFLKTLGSAGKLILRSYLGDGHLSAEVLSVLEAPLFNLVTAGYSRTHEFEADAHILKVFDKTGYDPQKSSMFFKTLLKIYPDNSKSTTSLFSSHPGTRDRIAKLDEQSQKKARQVRSGDPAGWATLKEKFPTVKGFRQGR